MTVAKYFRIEKKLWSQKSLVTDIDGIFFSCSIFADIFLEFIFGVFVVLLEFFIYFWTGIAVFFFKRSCAGFNINTRNVFVSVKKHLLNKTSNMRTCQRNMLDATANDIPV